MFCFYLILQCWLCWLHQSALTPSNFFAMNTSKGPSGQTPFLWSGLYFLHQAKWKLLSTKQLCRQKRVSTNHCLTQQLLHQRSGNSKYEGNLDRQNYGLMQAGREWPQPLDIQIESFGIKQHPNHLRLQTASVLHVFFVQLVRLQDVVGITWTQCSTSWEAARLWPFQINMNGQWSIIFLNDLGTWQASVWTMIKT